MGKMTVILADDHAILRYGISTFLSGREDIEVVGEASSGEACLRLFKEHRPDLSIIDIGMPGMDGIEVVKAIRDIDPDAKILILTMHSGRPMLEKALEADIDGYLLKSTPKVKILEAMRAIADGETAYSRSIQDILDRESESLACDDDSSLTRREKEILKLVVEGYSSPEIGKKLYISPRTVDTHRTNLMKKLDMHNTASLVRYALQNDLVSSEE